MDDLISRKALCEYALNQKDKSITPNDIMRFPSAQPEPCKDAVKREDVQSIAEKSDWFESSDSFNNFMWALYELPSAQTEITEDDVKEYCRKRCLIVVTSDFYDEMMSRWSSAQTEWAQKVEEYRQGAPSHIHNPLAWALYQTWKEYDR